MPASDSGPVVPPITQGVAHTTCPKRARVSMLVQTSAESCSGEVGFITAITRGSFAHDSPNTMPATVSASLSSSGVDTYDCTSLSLNACAVQRTMRSRRSTGRSRAEGPLPCT